MASSDREFVVDDVGEDGRLDRQAVVQALIDCEAVGHRQGMAITAAPVRVEYQREGLVRNGQPEVECVGWTFKLSRVPLASRAPQPGPEEPTAIYEAPISDDGMTDEGDREPEIVADALEAARNGG